MNSQELYEALAAGGVDATDLDGEPSNRVRPCSSLLDPRGAEALGQRLAEALRVYEPTRVMVWEDIENTALAHIVARELEVAAIRVVDASGVLDYDGAFGDDDRVVIIGDAFRTELPVTEMKALTTKHGGEVVALGALIATPVLNAASESTPTVALWTNVGKAGVDS